MLDRTARAPHGIHRPGRSAAVKRAMRHARTDLCPTGKKTYRTARKARITLTALYQEGTLKQRALRQRDEVERHFYQCPRCGYWHLTSQQ